MRLNTIYCDNCKEKVKTPYKYEIKFMPFGDKLQLCLAPADTHYNVKDFCGSECILKYIQKFLAGEL